MPQSTGSRDEVIAGDVCEPGPSNGSVCVGVWEEEVEVGLGQQNPIERVILKLLMGQPIETLQLPMLPHHLGGFPLGYSEANT